MSEHIELTEPCGVLTVPGVREYVCRLEPVGDDTVNVTVCAPTEPIVRCRDCKHFRIEPWDEVLAAQYGAPPMICERTGDMDAVVPDGFCSWACRREKREP